MKAVAVPKKRVLSYLDEHQALDFNPPSDEVSPDYETNPGSYIVHKFGKYFMRAM